MKRVTGILAACFLLTNAAFAQDNTASKKDAIRQDTKSSTLRSEQKVENTRLTSPGAFSETRATPPDLNNGVLVIPNPNMDTARRQSNTPDEGGHTGNGKK